MSFKKLLLQNDMKKPKIKQKNGKITIYVNYNEKVFDAKSLEEFRKEINYIYENDIELISNKNSNIRILINTGYFKDRTVVLILELIIYSLCLKGNFNIYINIRVEDKESIAYNFYYYSFLKEINRKQITNKKFCIMYEKFSGRIYKQEIIGANIRKIIDKSTYKDVYQQMHMQQRLSSDIMSILSLIVNNEDMIDDACEIVDELIDNILSHTIGFGIVDVAAVKVISKKDNDDYIHIMINVINISDNFLYTNIKETYRRNVNNFKLRSKIKDYYEAQREFFLDSNYSENMFFMVSAFQRGVSTRNRNKIGGTGLNKSIMNFSKMSQKDLPENQSYVYSNKDILMFNENILSSELIGENIAFNYENDFSKKPDEICLSNSTFNLNGTAYNLMYVVKEE
ncbi:hypothetical protein DWX89_09805 [Coprobacillus sp. AF21-8LB]|uniref:hypothetical protein n=1 Tax=Faecalibacillus TaxID=2678885 RepID=UPI000E53E973|nr:MULTISPECIES: hypothetical protein [Faecalibacillus]RGG31714.1 hypothetical protein DWY19_05055 [Coprobacillus sp. AF24-1LB]RHQ83928.1 hypothetical protein DWX89_09805 [Coprobacillus sp. AF21-8LB]